MVMAFVFFALFIVRPHNSANLNGILELASLELSHHRRLTDVGAKVIVRAMRDSGFVSAHQYH